MADFRDLIKPSRLTHIVHVGASAIDGPPVYRAMMEEGLCHLTGFEPNPDALETLNKNKGPNQTFLPHIIGAHGPERTLHITHAPGMISLLEPDTLKLNAFGRFHEWGDVKDKVTVNVTPFDAIHELEFCDLLVMDAQGAEVEVLHSGETKLAGCAAVLTEVSWVPLYKDQPPFGVIDLMLRRLGFLPHCFAGAKVWPVTTFGGRVPASEPHQLLEADILYVKDFTHTRHPPEVLKQLAMIAHYVAASYDLAMRCVRILETRDCLPPKSAEAYTQILEKI